MGVERSVPGYMVREEIQREMLKGRVGIKAWEFERKKKGGELGRRCWEKMKDRARREKVMRGWEKEGRNFYEGRG